MADNPFLLPSPGSGTPAAPATPKPTRVPQATPPARDPRRFIALPPSIESATHRIPRSEPDPGPKPDRGSAPLFDPIAEETSLVLPARPESTALSLLLPDGVRVSLMDAVLLGRNPAPITERPGARLVSLADPRKTVSKTHALLEPAPPDGVRVRDLYSTNGIAINFDGTRTVLPQAGEAVAPVGALIEFGSFVVTVTAAAD